MLKYRFIFDTECVSRIDFLSSTAIGDGTDDARKENRFTVNENFKTRCVIIYV